MLSFTLKKLKIEFNKNTVVYVVQSCFLYVKILEGKG